MNIKNIAAICVALGLTIQTAHAEMPSSAGNPEQTIKNLISILVQSKVLTQDAADELLRAAAQPAVQPVTKVADAVAPGVVRVPYVPEIVRQQIKDEIKDEVLAQAKGERWGDPGSMPGWLSRISFSGDFRVRDEYDRFPSGNASAYNFIGIANTTENQNFMKLQARLGIKAKVSDDTFTAFRIATGSTTNPVSTNQTMGANGNFNKYALVLDRAYVQSDPYYWLMMSAGKMPNPWLSTDLVWDTDVNFEGVAASLKPRFSDSWSAFLTAGAFPVQNVQRTTATYSNNKWLYGAQAGVTWTAQNMSTAKFGVALYDFQNLAATQNTYATSTLYNGTAASSMQKGNSLMYVNYPGDATLYGLASQFKELNVTGKFDLATFDPVHVMLTADYVKNLDFNLNSIVQRSGIAASYYAGAGNTGYQMKLDVGMPEIHERGDWQTFVGYKYLQSDAVLDALTDSDFNLGGTNAKGYIVGGSYGVDKNTWLTLRYLSADQIAGAPLSIDVLQLDLSARF